MMPVDLLNEIHSSLNVTLEAMGVSYKVFALLIPLVVWLIRKPVARLVLKIFKIIAKALGITIGNDLETGIVPATRVLIVTLGALVANYTIRLPEPFYSVINNLLVSICVVSVFSASYSQCIYLPQLLKKNRKKPAPEQVELVVRVAQVAVVLLGFAAVMKVWGIDIGPALTGMGVAGAALALASQDYLKNLMGGFNNAAERRFRVGDLICVEGLVEGVVESVELRSTLIRRLDSSPVHVPNSELANAAIVNHGRRLRRRIYWKVALTYDTPVDVLREISSRVKQYIAQNEHFVSADEASQFVRIDSLNESSVDMLVYCFTRSTVYGDYLEAKEELVLNIKSIVLEAGGGFAFPSRSIYVATGENDNVEHEGLNS